MAFYSYLSTKIIMAFITKSYQNLFGVRSYINARKYYFLAYDDFYFMCQNNDRTEQNANSCYQHTTIPNRSDTECT